MISFFQKKKYLVDLLEGFTDFHNHLLPGIDDGSKSVEESLEMIRKYEEFGVKNFVATPHVMGDYYPNTPETINAAFGELKPVLPEDVELKASGEYMMDQHLLNILDENLILPLHKQFLLVEMSYFQAPINLNEILFKIQNKAFKPILAHPERYVFFHSKKLEEYKNLKTRGCDFQLNLLSLTSHYGLGIQKMAFDLLENQMIDYLSSDAHRLEHLEKITKIRLNKKQVRLIEPVLEKSRALFNS